jgi:shikimate kinase
LSEFPQTKNPKAGSAQDCRLICLTGFMGSGKSTVGRVLAARLAWHFVDLDTEIERQADLRISQIFEQRGEAVFREIEHECLSGVLGRILERDTRAVLALGGGTFAQLRNATLIRKFNSPQPSAAVVIWLDCPMEELLKRCALMDNRPLFRDEASFRKLYEDRLPHYQLADYRVEAGGEASRVVERILGLGITDRPVRPVAEGNPLGPSST